MEEKEYIKNFINGCRENFGQVPNFIHTTKENKVNYSGPYFNDDELVASIHSLLFGKWLSAGEKVREFEKAFSEKFKVGDSVMVNSGSSANLIMIAAMKEFYGWKDGDEIILSVVGFPTTLSAILLNNLRPVFVDIELETLNFDLNEVERKVTDRTVGVFISPVLGNPPDFSRLFSLPPHVHLILDNCDSLGSKWKGLYLNEYVDASSCSFYPAHHITTGEGGMISSDEKGIIKIARSMVNWGRACTCVGEDNLLSEGKCGKRFNDWLGNGLIIDHKYIFEHTGYNLKPLDLQGAIGIEQLKKFDDIFDKRKYNKKLIDLVFESASDCHVIGMLPYADTSWFGVPLLCDNGIYKRNLVQHLEHNGIQTRNYFAGNILLHPAYKNHGEWNQYPNANQVLDRVFFVGCSPNYTIETIAYFKQVLKKMEL